MNKREYIIIHHTASSRDKTTFEAVNRFHKNKNWGTVSRPVYAKPSSLGFYAQYHYLITGGGTVQQARKDVEVGWHTAGMNHKAIGICLTGWFDDGHDGMPSPAQQKSLNLLLQSLMKRYSIPLDKVNFHRDFCVIK